jgi:hypothetical protein
VLIFINWYKIALNSSSSGQAYWIDKNGQIIAVENHNRYIFDNANNIFSQKDIDSIMDIFDDEDFNDMKDYMVENFNWIRAYSNYEYSVWTSVVCKNIFDNSTIRRIGDFLFSIDPPKYMSIVIEDLNENRVSFPWHYFTTNEDGMAFSEFVKKEIGGQNRFREF